MNFNRHYIRNTLLRNTKAMFSSISNNEKNMITPVNNKITPADNKITNVNTRLINFNYKSNKNNTFIILELFPNNDTLIIDPLIIDPNLVKLTKDYFHNFENKEKVYYAIDSLASQPTSNTYKKIYFDKIETIQIENYINANLNNKLYSIVTYSMYHLIKTVFSSGNK